MSDPVTVGVVTDVGAIAQAAGAAFKALDDILEILNSPVMIQARKNVEVQKLKDQFIADARKAIATGDVTEVAKDLQ